VIEQSELIERWSNTDRVLDAMTEHERQHHWDMSTWGRKTDCGTVACAAGTCGLDAWFRERGFKTVFPLGSTEARTPPVADFFGLEGSERIFYNAQQRPVETVIEEVRTYVTELRHLAALETVAGLPKIGEAWPEQGGVFAGARLGVDGAPDYYLIVGPEHDDVLDWNSATNWAGRLSIAGHSDFGLPRRNEGAALFDRVRQLFQQTYYWLAEQRAGCPSNAWNQDFNDGRQDYWNEDSKLRARAVRRLVL
jgi:hypothetical protein